MPWEATSTGGGVAVKGIDGERGEDREALTWTGSIRERAQAAHATTYALGRSERYQAYLGTGIRVPLMGPVLWLERHAAAAVLTPTGVPRSRAATSASMWRSSVFGANGLVR